MRLIVRAARNARVQRTNFIRLGHIILGYLLQHLSDPPAIPDSVTGADLRIGQPRRSAGRAAFEFAPMVHCVSLAGL